MYHIYCCQQDFKSLIEAKSDAGIYLWALFVDAVLEFYFLKEAMQLLRKASKNNINKEEHPVQPSSITKRVLNYKDLLQEIMAYYKLTCQFDSCDKSTLPTVLCCVLTC